jgi:hypothetical protein
MRVIKRLRNPFCSAIDLISLQFAVRTLNSATLENVAKRDVQQTDIGGKSEFTPLGNFALRGLGTAVSLFAVSN